MKFFFGLTGLLLGAVLEVLLGNCGLIVPLMLCSYLVWSRHWRWTKALGGAFAAGAVLDVLYLRGELFSIVIFMLAVALREFLPWSRAFRETLPGQVLGGLLAGVLVGAGALVENLGSQMGMPHAWESVFFAVVSGGLLLPGCQGVADLIHGLWAPEAAAPTAMPLQNSARSRRQVSSRELFHKERP